MTSQDVLNQLIPLILKHEKAQEIKKADDDEVLIEKTQMILTTANAEIVTVANSPSMAIETWPVEDKHELAAIIGSDFLIERFKDIAKLNGSHLNWNNPPIWLILGIRQE